MTVEVNDTIERYTISGVGPYAFSFRVFADSDLQVTALSTDTPAEPTLLTLDSHYTVSGANDDDGGSVTLTSGAASTYAGYTLDIRSNTAQEQPTSVRNQGRFLPEIHEDAFDRLSRQVQDLSRRVDASFRYPDNMATDGALSPIQSWVSKYLAIGPTGVLEPAELTSSGALTQSIIGDLLYPRTSAEISAGVTPVNYAYEREYIERQGAVGDLSTDNLTAINRAVTVADRQIRSYDGDFLVSAEPTNPLGVEFRGTGAILKADSLGGYQQLNTYADLHKYCIGKEYLYRVYQRLIVGIAGSNPIKAFAFGDSTIAGGNGESANFRVQTLLPNLCKYKGLVLPMTCTNRGVAGTKIGDMSALGDLAVDTDLYFIKYGINDSLNSLSTRLDTFASDLRSKLAAIRADTYGDYDTLSIVLVGPNSTNDSPQNRDERWYEQLRGVYVQAARDYKCMYFDTYAWLKDSRGAATFWLDNPYSNGIGIHPQDNMQAWIWGAVIDAMFGQSEAASWRGNHVTNTSGTFDTPAHSAAPSAYTYGVSIARATTGQGWPEDGYVTTIVGLDGPAVQFLYPFASGRTVVLKRIADTGGNAWNLWTGQVVALTLTNSWVTFGGGFDTPKAVLGDDGIVTVTMIIKNGTTTAGTTLTTLPAGMRPAATAGPFPTVNSSGVPAASVRVDTSGNVIAHAALDASATSIQFSFRAA